MSLLIDVFCVYNITAILVRKLSLQIQMRLNHLLMDLKEFLHQTWRQRPSFNEIETVGKRFFKTPGGGGILPSMCRWEG